MLSAENSWYAYQRTLMGHEQSKKILDSGNVKKGQFTFTVFGQEVLWSMLLRFPL
jgi:hypothetical protein